MKKLLLSFGLMFFVKIAGSQVVSTPTLIPAQPTPNDIVKVVTKVTTPYQAIVVDPCTANVSSGHILIKSCYCQGMLPATQTFVDTLTLGQLSSGSYTIMQTAFSSTAQQHCTKNDSNMVSVVITVQQTTRLSKTEIENNLLVYPNPATKFVNIRNVSESTVYVYSASGALVKQVRISENGQVDVSELPNGMYILKLEEADRMKVTRIVKYSNE